MSDKWWVVEGVIVELNFSAINGEAGQFEDFHETLILNNEHIKKMGSLEFFNPKSVLNYKPRGVPFDCMPEWATKIYFNSIGDVTFLLGDVCCRECIGHSICFSKCPEQWKGNTYQITDELRELIK